MKRYYLSPTTGDGTLENAYRPVIADYHYNAVGVMDVGKGWALVLVDTEDHTELLNDGRFHPLPNIEKDKAIASVSTFEKTALSAKCSELDVPLTTKEANGTLRSLVQKLGRSLDSKFEESKMDVAGEEKVTAKPKVTLETI